MTTYHGQKIEGAQNQMVALRWYGPLKKVGLGAETLQSGHHISSTRRPGLRALSLFFQSTRIRAKALM